ncbi:winged helix repair factor 1-like [Brevipalpus obovatus]|uniref:winged helix repair factor 1-like n=1 Tax=Brevipalpus obovatus TaxID=246614 RepID=UPI003D9E8FB1
MAPKRKRDEIDVEAIKKICTQLDEKFNKVEDTLEFIKSLVDGESFGYWFPDIMLKHQCYPLMKNKTKVDIDLNRLCDEGVVRCFRLGTTIRDHETAVVFMDDYINYIRSLHKEHLNLINKFINEVLKKNSALSYTNDQLKEDYKLSEDEIKQLVHFGILAIHRTVGTWLLSIPNCGSFYKTFLAGRKSLLNLLKRARYNEMSRTELLSRKPPKDMKLSVAYHVLDIIGSDLVQSIDSPVGPLFRLLGG